jgi:hypothetical protein
MNHLHPLDLKDLRINAPSSSVRTGRKLVIGLLVLVILSVMIAWVGFLGWGVVEMLRTIASWTESLWMKIF